MKKVLSVLIILAAAVLLAGCQAFSGSTTNYKDEDTDEMVFVQFSDTVLSDAEALMNIKSQLEQTGVTESGVEITAAKLDTDNMQSNGVIPLYLTLANVPQRKSVIKTSLFYKENTVTLFNTISILPQGIAGIAYYAYVETTRRFQTNSDPTLTQQLDNGDYVYMWTVPDDIVLTGTYPNTPLWYIIAIAAAAAVGVAVYFTCKNKAEKVY